uniref:Polyprotein n=1 Tax=Feksystermes virus TaxID=2796589 RepID=A0A894KN66_9VIRU|nr:polyprotein [Feksystermes virus]
MEGLTTSNGPSAFGTSGVVVAGTSGQSLCAEPSSVVVVAGTVEASLCTVVAGTEASTSHVDSKHTPGEGKLKEDRPERRSISPPPSLVSDSESDDDISVFFGDASLSPVCGRDINDQVDSNMPVYQVDGCWSGLEEEMDLTAGLEWDDMFCTYDDLALSDVTVSDDDEGQDMDSYIWDDEQYEEARQFWKTELIPEHPWDATVYQNVKPLRVMETERLLDERVSLQIELREVAMKLCELTGTHRIGKLKRTICKWSPPKDSTFHELMVLVDKQQEIKKSLRAITRLLKLSRKIDLKTKAYVMSPRRRWSFYRRGDKKRPNVFPSLLHRQCVYELRQYQRPHLGKYRRNWLGLYQSQVIYKRNDPRRPTYVVPATYVGIRAIDKLVWVVMQLTEQELFRAWPSIEQLMRTHIDFARMWKKPVQFRHMYYRKLVTQFQQGDVREVVHELTDKDLEVQGGLPQGFKLEGAQVEMIYKYITSKFLLPLSLTMTTNFVASVLSVIHHLYAIIKYPGAVNKSLGIMAIIGQVASLVMSILTMIKLQVDSSKVNEVATQVIKMILGEELVDQVDNVSTSLISEVVKETFSESESQQLFVDVEDERIGRNDLKFGVIRDDIEPQGIDSSLYIKLGVFAISTVITILSMKTGKQFDWMVIRNHQMRKAITETAKDVEELTSDIASEWFGVQISKDVALHSHLEKIYKRMQEILLIPPQEVVNNLTLYYEAQRLHSTVVEMIGRKTKSDQYGTRNLQTAIVRKSEEYALFMQKVVALMRQKSTRVETFALHLFGNPACGKTRFVNEYLNKRIAEEMGWPLDEVYPISFSSENDYWPEYTGARNAVYDEFFGRRDEDPIIPHLNKIMSNSFQLIPGAFVKQQYCNFRLLTLISNFHYCKLIGSMHEQVQAALYSRLHTYEVVNKNYHLIQGEDGGHIERGAANAYAPDFSHLTFQRRYIDGRTGHPIRAMNDVQPELSAEQIVEEVVAQLKKKEAEYQVENLMSRFNEPAKEVTICVEKCNEDLLESKADGDGWCLFNSMAEQIYEEYGSDVSSTDVRLWLQKRLECSKHTVYPGGVDVPSALESLNVKDQGSNEHLRAFAVEMNANICIHQADASCCEKVIVGKKQPTLHFMYRSGHWNPMRPVKEQSEETTKLVYLLYGPSGSGKSTLALKMADRLKLVTGMEIQEVVQDIMPLFGIDNLHPKIYVTHDTVTCVDYYQSFYDRVAAGSILLNTANLTVSTPILRNGNWFRVFNGIPNLPKMLPRRVVTWNRIPEEVAEGWLRRIGLPGSVMVKKQVLDVPVWRCMDLNVREYVAYDQFGSALSNEKVFARMWGQYLKYQERVQNVDIVRVNDLFGIKPLDESQIDVRVWSRTEETLWDLLESPVKVLMRTAKPAVDEGIIISSHLIQTKQVEFNPSQFMPKPRPSTREELYEFAKRMYNVLRRDGTEYTVQVKIDGTEVYCTHGKIYCKSVIEDVDPQSQFALDVGESYTKIQHGNEEYEFLNDDLVQYLVASSRDVFIRYPQVPVEVWMYLKSQKVPIMNSKFLEKYAVEAQVFEARRQFVKEVAGSNKGPWQMFQQSPWYMALKIVFGLIAGLVSVLSLVSLCHWMFGKDETGPTAAVTPKIVPSSTTPTIRAKLQTQYLDYLQTTVDMDRIAFHKKPILEFETKTPVKFKIRLVQMYDSLFDKDAEDHFWVGYGYITMECRHATYSDIMCTFYSDGDVTTVSSERMCQECEEKFELGLALWRQHINEVWEKEDLTYEFTAESNSHGKKKGKKKKPPPRKTQLRLAKAGSHANEPKTYYVGRDWVGVPQGFDTVDGGLKKRQRSDKGRSQDVKVAEKALEAAQAQVVAGAQGIASIPPLVDFADPTFSACVERCYKALCRVSCMGKEMHGLAIKGSFVLAPAHVIPYSWDRTLDKPGRLVQVWTDDAWLVKQRPYQAVIVSLSRDNELCMLRVLDRDWPQASDITKWFIREADVDKVHSGILCAQKGANRVMSGAHITVCRQNELRLRVAAFRDFSGSFGCAEFYQTSVANTAPGDCGFPYLTTDETLGRERIIGLHIAASRKMAQGISTVVTQEMIAVLFQQSLFDFTDEGLDTYDPDALLKVGKFHPEQKCENLFIPEIMDLIDQAEPPKFLSEKVRNDKGKNITIFGYVKGFGLMINKENYKECREPMPCLSQIVEILPIEKWPAVMTVDAVEDKSLLVDVVSEIGESRKSLSWTQVEYYCHDFVWGGESQQMMEEALELYTSWAVDLYGQEEHRILSYFETLNGISKGSLSGELGPIELDASCGPYWTWKYRASLKKEFFEVRRNNTEPGGPCRIYFDQSTVRGREMKSRLIQKEAYASEGQRMVFPAKDCLKAELLPVEKIKQGRTRLFTAVDSIDVLYARKVCGTLMASVKKHRARGHCQAGIDAWTEFTRLMMRFRKISNVGHCGDFKRWDKHLMPQVVSAAFGVLEKVFLSNTKESSDTVHNLLSVVFDDFVHTMTVHNGVLYMKHRGNPSGCVCNTLVNSICNDIMVFTVLWRQMKKIPRGLVPHGDYRSFVEKHIDWINLGDDLMVVVGKGLQPYFPFPVLAQGIKELFGMTMTHPSKDEKMASLDFTPLEKCDFISRAFHSEGDLMVWPRLKTVSISSLLHWVSARSSEQIEANCRMALDEAVMHPPEYFRKVVSCVQILVKNKMCDVSIPSYDHMRGMIKSGVLNDQRPASKNLQSLTLDVKTGEVLPVSQILQKRILVTMSGSSEGKGKFRIYEDLRRSKKSNDLSCLIKEDSDLYQEAVEGPPAIEKREKKAPGSATEASCQMSLRKVQKYTFDKLLVRELFSTHLALAGKVSVVLQERIGVFVRPEFYNRVRFDSEEKNVCVEGKTIRVSEYPGSEQIPAGYYMLSMSVQASIAEVPVAFPIVIIQRASDVGCPIIYDPCGVCWVGAALIRQQTVTYPMEVQGVEGLAHSDGATGGPDAGGSSAGNLESIGGDPQYGQFMDPVGKTAVNPKALAEGGFMSRWPEICYERYFTVGAPVVITQDKPVGTILLDLPYGTGIMNDYMKTWMMLHDRATGDIDLQIVLSGAEIYRGLLLVAVYPKWQSSYTINDLEKYKCDLKPMQQVGTDGHTLGFQSQVRSWYRTVGASGDLLPVYGGYSDTNYWAHWDEGGVVGPRLIVAIYSQLDNPFENPGSTCYMFVRTKFGKNFKVSIPTIPSSLLSKLSSPALLCAGGGNIPRVLSRLEGMSLSDIVKLVTPQDVELDERKLTICLDGRYYPTPGDVQPFASSDVYGVNVNALAPVNGIRLSRPVARDVDLDYGVHAGEQEVCMSGCIVYWGQWAQDGTKVIPYSINQSEKSRTVNLGDWFGDTPVINGFSWLVEGTLPARSEVVLGGWSNPFTWVFENVRRDWNSQSVPTKTSVLSWLAAHVDDLASQGIYYTYTESSVRAYFTALCLRVSQRNKGSAIAPVLGSYYRWMQLRSANPEVESSMPNALRIRFNHRHGMCDILFFTQMASGGSETTYKLYIAQGPEHELSVGSYPSVPPTFTGSSDWPLPSGPEWYSEYGEAMRDFRSNRLVSGFSCVFHNSSDASVSFATPVDFANAFTALPPNTYSLVFAYGDTPLVSAGTTAELPSNLCSLVNASLLRYFASEPCEAQVLDFDLVDPNTETLVLHVRYNVRTSCFYVDAPSVPDSYAIYSGDAWNLVLKNASTKPTVSSLLRSDATYWYPRTVVPESAVQVVTRRLRRVRFAALPAAVVGQEQGNVATSLGAGALQGVGSGLSNWQNQQYALQYLEALGLNQQQLASLQGELQQALATHNGDISSALMSQQFQQSLSNQIQYLGAQQIAKKDYALWQNMMAGGRMAGVNRGSGGSVGLAIGSQSQPLSIQDVTQGNVNSFAPPSRLYQPFVGGGVQGGDLTPAMNTYLQNRGVTPTDVTPEETSSAYRSGDGIFVTGGEDPQITEARAQAQAAQNVADTDISVPPPSARSNPGTHTARSRPRFINTESEPMTPSEVGKYNNPIGKAVRTGRRVKSIFSTHYNPEFIASTSNIAPLNRQLESIV